MGKLCADAVVTLFNSDVGCRIYNAAKGTLANEIGTDRLKSGVLIGLSGGADSVMLLLLLCEFRRREGLDFNIICCHVNHKIRGDEADRDMRFSVDICTCLGIECITREIDVPSFASERGIGIEEAARECRYSKFSEIISGREDVSYIAVAHNADDNAETVLFNLVRGSGLRGIRGILPVRDNIIRPLIRVRGCDIRTSLEECGIKFVVDSTNLSDAYSRNFIRLNIIPRLNEISCSAVSAISRSTVSLAQDDDFIDSCALVAYKSINKQNISTISLSSLHPALFARVFTMLCHDFGCMSVEFCHISEAWRIVNSDNSSVMLSNGISFVCERGCCRFVKECDKMGNTIKQVSITDGVNHIPGTNACIIIGQDVDKSLLNIYNFSIQADLSSAIIKGGLYIRSRKPGDSYYYGGMTHKLKKVFNDRNIPPSERNVIPVLCDEGGILWVPGLGVRDDGNSAPSHIVRFCTREARDGEYSLLSAIIRHN